MSVARRGRRLGALLAIGVLVVGCGDDRTAGTTTDEGSDAGPTGEITVSAAASLTGVFTELGSAFERGHPGTTVRFNFDSSGSLATQIEAGALADVFASADATTLDRLVGAGLVDGSPVVFARNLLTIVVKPGNPGGVTSLADLAAAGVVSLCAETAPCGRYAADVLSRAGVALPVETVTRAQNATATLAAVAGGDADAGIVYVTDAMASPDVDRIEIPERDNVVADYPVAMVAGAANPDAALAFVEYVAGDDAREVLEAAGFLAP